MKFSSYLSDPEIQELLGERLRQLRIGKMLTQNDLAVRAGVSRGAVRRLENGRGIDLKTFVAILRSLNLVDSLERFLPEPGPSIKSLKELREPPLRQRVRK